ncbi:MAG: patatin-like phospholipase family protein [Myxococcota bacterium]
MTVDIVLSAGWLAFARHIGFLEGLTDQGIEVEAVVGTSSGSLVGALWAAGLTLDAIAEEVTATRPFQALRPSRTPWKGVCSMGRFMKRLERHLPARFEDLDRPFAVGVCTGPKTAHLLTSGSLIEAVAASCAVPGLFSPVNVDGKRWLDGGYADRTAVDGWRQWRPNNTGLLHLIESTRGDFPAPQGITTVRSPPSGAHLWSFGDHKAQRTETRALTQSVLDSSALLGSDA